MRIGAVILAGGEGRRIGGGKPGRLLGDKSLFDHVLDRVKAWQLPCAVAVRKAAEANFAASLPLLEDEGPLGPIGGIASAFEFAIREGFEAVLTLPCDTPFLPVDLPTRLQNALAPPAQAAIAASHGRLHPSCALWSVAAAPKLGPYLERQRSLVGFAGLLQAATVFWPAEPNDPFFNVNDEDDLEAAEAILKSR